MYSFPDLEPVCSNNLWSPVKGRWKGKEQPEAAPSPETVVGIQGTNTVAWTKAVEMDVIGWT